MNQSSPNPEDKPPVEIPKDSLSAEALNGIVESYILRDGTDYGVEEVTLNKKKEQIHRKIDKKEIRIVFDFNSQSVTLITSQEWLKFVPRAQP